MIDEMKCVAMVKKIEVVGTCYNARQGRLSVESGIFIAETNERDSGSIVYDIDKVEILVDSCDITGENQ